jgi:hypothetical protein
VGGTSVGGGSVGGGASVVAAPPQAVNTNETRTNKDKSTNDFFRIFPPPWIYTAAISMGLYPLVVNGNSSPPSLFVTLMREGSQTPSGFNELPTMG